MDIGERSGIYKVLAWTMPVGIVLLLLQLPFWVIVGVLVLLNVTINAILNRGSKGLVDLLYGQGQQGNIHDLVCGDLDRVRFYKRHQRYDEALRVIDEILAVAPEYPEALYLKARIVWESTGDKKQALADLKAAMAKLDKTTTLYKWAANFHHELQGNSIDKPDGNAVVSK